MPAASNQVRKRFVLLFSKEIVDQPIIHQLCVKFQVSFNILNAAISPERMGRIVIELGGTAQQLDAAVLYLKQAGVTVDSLNQEVKRNELKCIQCGTCDGFCPTGALTVQRPDMLVHYDPEKCVLCERCLTACPTHAMEFGF